MVSITFRAAEQDDTPAVRALLRGSGLAFMDVGLTRQDFILAVRGGEIVGTVGLEAYGAYGLLRSLAVDVRYRDRGLGRGLLDKMEAHARARGVRELYLLTETAVEYFAGRGFELTERAGAPAPLQQTTEFLSQCHKAAICMKKRI